MIEVFCVRALLDLDKTIVLNLGHYKWKYLFLLQPKAEDEKYKEKDITPARALIFPKWHSCARWKALLLAHTAACHEERMLEHTQPCKRCTLVSGWKHPKIQSSHILDSLLQCTVLLQLPPTLLEVVQIYTEMYAPKTASPKMYIFLLSEAIMH